MLFTVTDTGPGVPASQIDAIFQPFYQVDSGGARAHQGTGLGLAISRRLAELLGGSLGVTSVAGRGSEFRFTIPAELAPDDGSSEAPVPLSQGPLEFPRGLVGRVLVAEDTRAVQFLLRRVFDSFEGRVDYVGDGQEALDAEERARADGDPYDLVLLDMHMPRVTGYDAAAALRQRGVSTPIVALTASAMAGDREACLAAGCDAYLPKPIDWNDLIAEVVHQLQQPPVDSATPPTA